MGARFDKRIRFVAIVMYAGFSGNVKLINEWYCNNKGHKYPNNELLEKFREWLDLSEPV